MKYVIIGDLHCKLTNYSLTVNGIPEQLYFPLKNLKNAAKYAKENNAKLIIAGDIINSKLLIHQQIITEVMETLLEIKNDNVDIYILLGNHDYEILNEKVYSYLLNLNIKIATPQNPIIEDEFALVSYSKPELMMEELQNINTDNLKLLVSHLGLIEGELTGSEFKIGEFSIKQFSHLKNVWIILGHYHKPQKVSERIYYVGSPIPTRLDELDEEKRFLFLDTDKDEIKSISTEYPKIKQFDLTIDEKINIKEIEKDIKKSFSKYIFNIPSNYNYIKELRNLSNNYRGYIFLKTKNEDIEYNKIENIENINLKDIFNDFLKIKTSYEEKYKDEYLNLIGELL